MAKPLKALIIFVACMIRLEWTSWNHKIGKKCCHLHENGMTAEVGNRYAEVV
jgi:hypothetical protein